MITVTDSKYIGAGDYWRSFAGLSTDEKPAEEFGGIKIMNGSYFEEMDTGNLYYYDGAAGEWKKFGGDSDGN